MSSQKGKPTGESRTEKTRRWLKYEFSDVELQNLAKDMARRVQAVAHLEEEKKSIADTFKAKISTEASMLNQLSQWITTGYDFRDIDCEIRFNTPNNGKKTIVRLDNGEIVETIDMDATELQEPLL